MKNLLIILSLCLLICGCGSSNIDLLKSMDSNDYIIIDVRTDEEYIDSHIVSSINIPYDEISFNNNIDKDKTIFVYCKSGNRSKVAYNTLKRLGYTVYDLGSISSIDLPKE